MTIKRKRAIGPRKRCKQRGKRMIENLFKTGVNLGSRFLNSAIGRKIAEEGIKSVSNIYSAGVDKISNRKIQRALESNLANYAVNRAQKEFYNWKNV